MKKEVSGDSKVSKTQAFSRFGSDRLHLNVTGLLHDCFFSSWIASRSYKTYGKWLHLDVTGRSPTFKNRSFLKVLATACLQIHT